mgnify:CR=1 FL=1
MHLDAQTTLAAVKNAFACGAVEYLTEDGRFVTTREEECPACHRKHYCFQLCPDGLVRCTRCLREEKLRPEPIAVGGLA